MIPERLIQASSEIGTDNKTERSRILDERIESISLYYAEKKLQELSVTKPYFKFSEAVRFFTPIEAEIKRVLYSVSFNRDEYKERVDSFFDKFHQELDDIYKTSGLDFDAIEALIKTKKETVISEVGLEKTEDSTNKKRRSKIEGLSISKPGFISDIDNYDSGRWKDLKKYNFSSVDDFIEFHLRVVFETGESIGGELLIKELGIIAEYIVDHKPETAAILGRSWLISTPIGKRLGFIKIEDEDEIVSENDATTWFQFIDEDGQINKKRFNTFVESGKLPFKSVRAYIPTEIFLRKFLPKERRGQEIILKEIDKDEESWSMEFRANLKEVRSSWYKMIEGKKAVSESGDTLPEVEIDYLTEFINSQCFQKFLENFASDKDRDVYIEFIKKMYKETMYWPYFKDLMDETTKDSVMRMWDKVNGTMYKSRKISV